MAQILPAQYKNFNGIYPLGDQATVISNDPDTAFWGKYSLLVKAVGFLLASGAGFYYFEKESWPDLTYMDSLWWSVVTAMTVGYGDIYPKTWQGRWLVAAPTIFLGVGLLAYTFGLVESETGLKYAWRRTLQSSTA